MNVEHFVQIESHLLRAVGAMLVLRGHFVGSVSHSPLNRQ